MFTLCPQCRTVYPVTVAQLRRGRGKALCGRCGATFSSLQHLGRTIEETLSRHSHNILALPRLKYQNAVATGYPPASAPDSTFAQDASDGKQRPAFPSLPLFSPAAGTGETQNPPLYWKIGVGALILVFMVQLAYFEADHWANKVHLRAPMEILCSWLGCNLPPFQNTAEIEVVDRSFHPARNSIDGYELYLAMVNHAPYPQPCPLLKVSLTALDGTLIAQRIFKPDEYLSGTSSHTMPSHRMIFVQLAIAAPKRAVGGYQVEFVR